jgi:hypothetical protein
MIHMEVGHNVIRVDNQRTHTDRKMATLFHSKPPKPLFCCNRRLKIVGAQWLCNEVITVEKQAFAQLLGIKSVNGALSQL